MGLFSYFLFLIAPYSSLLVCRDATDFCIFISYYSLWLIVWYQSILSDISIATSAFFWFTFTWGIFFYLFTFTLLNLKWISFRQHIVGSCSFCFVLLFIHSATVGILIGKFSPFTFKVIIYRYNYCHFVNCFPVIL